MATIYILDETKAKLDLLLDCEKRNISNEIDFLVSERCKKLNLHSKVTKNKTPCQEKISGGKV